MYCIIKCIVQGKQARVKNADFASSVSHSCNVKTQICVTRPQCVNTYRLYHNHIYLMPLKEIIAICCEKPYEMHT